MTCWLVTGPLAVWMRVMRWVEAKWLAVSPRMRPHSRLDSPALSYEMEPETELFELAALSSALASAGLPVLSPWSTREDEFCVLGGEMSTSRAREPCSEGSNSRPAESAATALELP